MSETDLIHRRSPAEPLPDNLKSVQPGGGVCYEIELAWGRWRRWYLKHLRPRYVEQMAALRQGDPHGAPHEILDCRDLKYCRNQCTADWEPIDDPFRWREMIPFARWGLAELLLMGLPLAVVTAALAHWGWWVHWAWSILALATGVILGLIVYFFRDPPRRVPTGPGLVVSPADGRVAEITPLDHDEFIGGPAVRIGIFLSIFNVHLNRAPARTRVIRLRYSPGLFLNAMNPESALRNENLWIGLEEADFPYRRMVVRQIAGLFARRIVCNLRSDETLERGQKFGMIKLGSRTELILPAEPGLELCVVVGDKVHAGSTTMARLPAASPAPTVNGQVK
jgi:phosphatidylserine decarboxylase